MQRSLLHLDDVLDPVARLDAVEHLLAGDHLPEDRVAAVEMRLGREGEEELAAAGVRAGERHADPPAGVAPAIDLVADGVARAAEAVAAGIAALHHEVGNDAMEGEAVVEALAGEVEEVEAGQRRVGAVEAEGERASAGAPLDPPRPAGPAA